jgi:hypothetical protein
VDRVRQSPLVLILLNRIERAGLPAPEQEVPFAKDLGRRWRFDLAWSARRVAVEVEGGVYSGGRHTRGAGFEQDCTKYNTATTLGWAVYRVTRGMIESGEAVALLGQALGGADG